MTFEMSSSPVPLVLDAKVISLDCPNLLTCRESVGKAIFGFALQEGHDPGVPGGGEPGCDFSKGGGREAEPVDGNFLAAGSRMGIFAGGGVVVEAAEGVEIGAGIERRAVEMFGGEGVDAAEEGGMGGGKIKMQERKFEQFPAVGGAQQIAGIEVAMDETGLVERTDGVEGLVDEVEPGFGIERASLDDLAEGLAAEKFEHLVGAVLAIAAQIEELDPSGMEERQRMGGDIGASLLGKAQGDVVLGGVIAGAKDTGFAARPDRFEQEVAIADEDVFHGEPCPIGNHTLPKIKWALCQPV